jgi:hypothetical protein
MTHAEEQLQRLERATTLAPLTDDDSEVRASQQAFLAFGAALTLAAAAGPVRDVTLSRAQEPGWSPSAWLALAASLLGMAGLGAGALSDASSPPRTMLATHSLRRATTTLDAPAVATSAPQSIPSASAIPSTPLMIDAPASVLAATPNSWDDDWENRLDQAYSQLVEFRSAAAPRDDFAADQLEASLLEVRSEIAAEAM